MPVGLDTFALKAHRLRLSVLKAHLCLRKQALARVYRAHLGSFAESASQLRSRSVRGGTFARAGRLRPQQMSAQLGHSTQLKAVQIFLLAKLALPECTAPTMPTSYRTVVAAKAIIVAEAQAVQHREAPH